MRRGIWIAVATLTVGIAAAAGIACSDDDAPTLEAYFTEVQALAERSDQQANDAIGEFSDDTTGDELKGRLKDLAKVLEDTSDDFDDIDPADAAKDKHDALGDALDKWAKASTKSAKALEDLDANASVDDVFNKFNDEDFVATQEAFNNACKALEQVATDNNIEADLNCDDEDDEVAAAEQAVRDAAAAWNASDVDGLVSHFTDAGLRSAFGADEGTPREEVIDGVRENIGDGAIDIRELEAELTDEGANVTVLWVSGKVFEHLTFSLLMNDDGDWQINEQEQLPVDVPAGYATIDVSMTEFAFAADTAKIKAGTTFALNAKNAGAQQHHVIFAKIPDDANLEELLRTEEDVPGFEFIGGMEPVDPGQSQMMVIGAPLDAGRYIFACFLPDTADAEGTPHAFKGMVTDFRIE